MFFNLTFYEDLLQKRESKTLLTKTSFYQYFFDDEEDNVIYLRNYRDNLFCFKKELWKTTFFPIDVIFPLSASLYKYQHQELSRIYRLWWYNQLFFIEDVSRVLNPMLFTRFLEGLYLKQRNFYNTRKIYPVIQTNGPKYFSATIDAPFTGSLRRQFRQYKWKFRLLFYFYFSQRNFWYHFCWPRQALRRPFLCRPYVNPVFIINSLINFESFFRFYVGVLICKMFRKMRKRLRRKYIQKGFKFYTHKVWPMYIYRSFFSLILGLSTNTLYLYLVQYFGYFTWYAAYVINDNLFSFYLHKVLFRRSRKYWLSLSSQGLNLKKVQKFIK